MEAGGWKLEVFSSSDIYLPSSIFQLNYDSKRKK